MKNCVTGNFMVHTGVTQRHGPVELRILAVLVSKPRRGDDLA
jgi:hypothetical protein